MTRPILTVIVPTVGRRTIRDTLASLTAQRLANCLEVIVVQDTHDRAYLPLDVSLGTSGLHSIRYYEHDGGINAWGHPQRNFAMPLAEGRWVCTLDDDDIWVPDAMDRIIDGVSNGPEAFNIFKMMHAANRVTIWDRKHPTQGNVGTPMMVWKNGTNVGEWGSLYEGDYTFVVSTIHKLPNGVDDIGWKDDVIALIRPLGVPAGFVA